MENKELIDIAKEILEECKKINSQTKRKEYYCLIADLDNNYAKFIVVNNLYHGRSTYSEDISEKFLFNDLYRDNIYTSRYPIEGKIKVFDEEELQDLIKNKLSWYFSNKRIKLITFEVDKFKYSYIDKLKYINFNMDNCYIHYLLTEALQPNESEQITQHQSTQDKQKKYYVGLLDPKNNIFKYVCSSTFDCDGYLANNEIFSKLFENNIFTNTVTTPCGTKIFSQSELDEFKKSEIILSLMNNYNLQIYTFDTDIADYDSIATENKQYYIYYLPHFFIFLSNDNIIFFNGFLNCKETYHLKLENNIEKAKLFNRADAIINIHRLWRSGHKGWTYIKKDDPDLIDFMKKSINS